MWYLCYSALAVTCIHVVLAGMYCCRVCSTFASPSFASVVCHIGSIHANNERLELVCPVPQCERQRPYRNFESFRSHVYRKHKNVLKNKVNMLSGVSSKHDSSSSINENRSGIQDVGGDNVPLNDQPDGSAECSITWPCSIQTTAARFLLRTKEERRVSQRALDGIVQDVTELRDEAFEQVCVFCRLIENSRPLADKKKGINPTISEPSIAVFSLEFSERVVGEADGWAWLRVVQDCHGLSYVSVYMYVPGITLYLRHPWMSKLHVHV